MIDPQILAYRRTGDGRAPVEISADDRSRHVFAIGRTGVGKSTLIRNLIFQDIAAGRGFSFFDPHGDDGREILDFIPADRIQDVVYFNPSDQAFPVGLNLLADRGDEGERDMVVESTIASLRQAWPQAWGNRMENVIRMGLYALLDEPGSTIIHLKRLILNKRYQAMLLPKMTNPAALQYWRDEFPKLTARQKIDYTTPVLSKVGKIAANSTLRNIFGQARSSFDLMQLMDEGKILIANFAGIAPKDADFIGSLLLTQYYLAGLRRRLSLDEGEELISHNLYLDEVHRFSTGTLADMLSEIRKFAITLTMAQQYLEQNEDKKVQKALLANVGTLAVFGVSHEDGKVLSQELDPQIVGAPELSSMSRGELYLRTSIDGVMMTQRALSYPAIPASRPKRGQSIINNSARAYAGTKTKVDKRMQRVFASEV